MQVQPPKTDLVLIGGGHSHLTVIKQLGMRPPPGVRITVISRDIHTPYSGMIPGLIAGHYQHDDAHIDLRPLCQFADARLFHSEVTQINMEQRLIYCNNRPPVRFDWLSINTGSQPDLASIPGANQVGIAIKPISQFLQRWHTVVESIKALANNTRIVVVGGGAASVEVIMAIQHQLQQVLGANIDLITFELLCAAPTLLAHHNHQVQKYIVQTLRQKHIKVKTGCTVQSAQQHPDAPEHKLLQLNTGEQLVCDELIWTIHAGSPSWISQTDLRCDNKGFIEVNPFLQSLSHPNVFAAGDIANFSTQPLAKSGVYAVRAGKILANNLRRAIYDKPLKTYNPQKRFLSLLMTGEQYAIASRGQSSISGVWVWHLKNYIDKKFIRSFSQLPSMSTRNQLTPILSSLNTKQSLTLPSNQSGTTDMRCGGCGAKVSHNILSRVIRNLNAINSADVILGLNASDDAAVITPPAGKQWLQTIDYFRAFINDPYLLGRIATNHCLSDIYAMGATPHSALALATVPYASNSIVEDTLQHLMQGAVDSLNEHNTALIGGHSSEGAELGFGLSVNGVVEPNQFLIKGKLETGQQLILTKPLGTGTLFAANMSGKAQGRWIEQALSQMLISNRKAAAIIHQNQATACTDITGFGVIGHLLEMLKEGELGARIYLHSLPLLDGAVYCARQGWLSSLQPENIHAQASIINAETFAMDQHYPLLFDPQTAGGLLAAIPKEKAEQCLNMLHQANCPHAAIIGEVDAELAATKIFLAKSI